MYNDIKDCSKNGFGDKGRIRAGFENYRAGKPILNNSQRLSKDEEVGRSKGGSRNVAATLFLRGYESADTAKQEQALTEFANANGCWFTLEEIPRQPDNYL